MDEKKRSVYILAGRCYCSSVRKLEQYTDGLSIMLGNIIEHLKLDNRTLNIFLFRNIVHGGYWNDNYKKRIIDNRFSACIKYFNMREFLSYCHRIRKISEIVKRYYIHMEIMLIEARISKDAFIVNTHDLSNEIIEVLQYCDTNGIPAVATLHIYVSDDERDILGRSNELLKLEQRLIENTNVWISVVSFGMKDRIISDFPNIDPNRIFVILNGTDFADRLLPDRCMENRNEKKRFLCVGTIGKWKNQEGLLQAISLLDQNMRKHIEFIFCGIDTTSGDFVELIKKLDLLDCVIYLGKISHRDMEGVYLSCDYTITTSLNEAFGLSIIEGFKYGKPAVFFDNIDAKEILFDDDCVCLIKGTTDMAIKNAIIQCVSKEWDTEIILQHSKKFDIENTAMNYKKLYNDIGGKTNAE